MLRPHRRRGPAGSRTRRGPGLRGLRPGPPPRAPGLPRRRAAAEGASESQPTPSRRALARPASAGERRNRRERGGAAAGARPDALLRCAGQLHRQLLLVPGASESPLVTTWFGSVREKRALGRRGGARNHRRSGRAGGGRAAAAGVAVPGGPSAGLPEGQQGRLVPKPPAWEGQARCTFSSSFGSGLPDLMVTLKHEKTEKTPSEICLKPTKRKSLKNASE